MNLPMPIKRLTRLLFSIIFLASCSKEDIKDPVAAFSQTSNNDYIAPTSITFSNESTDAGTYTWDFGDGSAISDNINPIHVYQEPGTYRVTLIAANGERVNQVQEEISVFALPTADFTYTSDNDFKATSSISFENKSLNSESYSWDFGDGGTSTQENPVHTYSQPNTYTVQLTATNAKGNDVKTAEIVIVPIETEEQSQFNKLKGSWTLESANDGQDRTADFPNLVLQIEGTYVEGGTYNYSFTGHRPDPSPWPVNGTWKFGTNKLTDLIRDPGSPSEIAMNYQVTDGNLIITFNVQDGSDGWPGGDSRVKSVSGDWIFTFTNL